MNPVNGSCICVRRSCERVATRARPGPARIGACGKMVQCLTLITIDNEELVFKPFNFLGLSNVRLNIKAKLRGHTSNIMHSSLLEA